MFSVSVGNLRSRLASRSPRGMINMGLGRCMCCSANLLAEAHSNDRPFSYCFVAAFRLEFRCCFCLQPARCVGTHCSTFFLSFFFSSKAHSLFHGMVVFFFFLFFFFVHSSRHRSRTRPPAAPPTAPPAPAVACIGSLFTAPGTLKAGPRGRWARTARRWRHRRRERPTARRI